VLTSLPVLDAECAAGAGFHHERCAAPEHRDEPVDGGRELVAVGEASDLEVIEQHVIAARDPRGHLRAQRGAPVLRRPVGVERDAVAERLQVTKEAGIGLA